MKLNKHLLAFLFYCLLTIWIGWPVWRNFSHILFGVQNDALGGIWAFWWVKYSLLNLGQTPFQSFYLGAPFGINLWPILTNWNLFFALPFVSLFGPLGAHNFFTLISFPLAGLAGFSLAYYFTKNFWASVFAGFVITLSPFHVTQSESFYHLAQIYWPIFYLLFLFKFDQKKNKANLFWLIFFFVLTAFSAQYYAIFNVLITLIFYLAKYRRRFFKEKKGVLSLTLAGLVILFIVGLVYLAKKGLGTDFALEDLNKGAVRWWYLLLPSEHHPFLGHLISSWRQGFSYSIQTVYLGLMPLVLGILAVIKIKNFPVRFFVVLIVISALLMIKPVIFIGQLKLPTLSYLLYLILPFVRILTRFSLLTLVSLAVLSAIFIDFYLKNKKPALKFGLLFFFFAFVFFEFMPPRTTTDLNEIPDYYQYLKDQPGEFLVVEYPFYDVNPWVWSPMYYQTYHQKKLIRNYFQPLLDQKTTEFLARQEDIGNPLFSRYLQLVGTKYVLVHTKDSDPQQQKTIAEKIKIDDFYHNLLLSPVKKFASAELLQINPAFEEVYATRQLVNITSSQEKLALTDQMLQNLDLKWPDYVLAFDFDKEKAVQIDYPGVAGKNTRENVEWENRKIAGEDGVFNDFLHHQVQNRVSYQVEIKRPGKYTLGVRLLYDDGLAFMKYEISSGDKKIYGGIYRPGAPGQKLTIKNYQIGEFALDPGPVKITFENIFPDEKLLPPGYLIAQTGEEKDALLKKGVPEEKIVPIFLYNGHSGIASLALTAKEKVKEFTPAPQISFIKKGENHFVVQVKDNQSPFFLILLKSFSLRWQTKVNGQLVEEKNHFLANDFANSWYIEKQGSYEIELRK